MESVPKAGIYTSKIIYHFEHRLAAVEPNTIFKNLGIDLSSQLRRVQGSSIFDSNLATHLRVSDEQYALAERLNAIQTIINASQLECAQKLSDLG